MWKLHLLPRWCGNTHGLHGALQNHHQQCSITTGSTLWHIWHKKIYLGTPLNRPKYVKIRLSDIPQEFIDKYDLENCTRDGWVYFKIRKGVYGLPQERKLKNDLLQKRLGTAGYYEVATTPGLCLHKWRPIIFSLIVDDFWIEYVEECMPNTSFPISKSTTS